MENQKNKVTFEKKADELFLIFFFQFGSKKKMKYNFAPHQSPKNSIVICLFQIKTDQDCFRNIST